MSLVVGKIYRLRFPGFGWVRVLPNPPRTVVTMDDGSPGYLVETLFTKSRWWARVPLMGTGHTTRTVVDQRNVAATDE